MPPRTVKPITRHRLETLTTERLLAYRNKLLSLEASLEQSDWNPEELRGIDPSLIVFKSDPRWSILYEDTLRVLECRQQVSEKRRK